MDGVVAGPADHEGLASPFGHELRPCWLWLSHSFEVGEFAHLVDLSVLGAPAGLAGARQQPSDQLFAAGDDRDDAAVVDDCAALSLERDTFSDSR